MRWDAMGARPIQFGCGADGNGLNGSMRGRLGQFYLRELLGVACLLALQGTQSALAQSEINRPIHSSGPLGEMMNEVFNEKAELSQYERLNRSAMESLAIREYREAFKLLKEALELETESPDAYVNFGLVHLERNEYASSEKAIEEALKRDPENARAWYWYSRVMLIKGEMNEARESSARAVAYSAGEDWKYLDWQAILLFDHGHFEKAAEVSGAALKHVSIALDRVKRGIQSEESKKEVASIEQDTEIVRDLGGAREVPVTRIRTENKDAPDDWYALREHLIEQRGNVAFRHAVSLAKLGRSEEIDAFLRLGFMADRDRMNEGLYRFAMMEYEASAKLLKRSSDLGNSGMSSLFGYLIGQIASNDQSGAGRTVRRLKKKIAKDKIHWAADALRYIGQYAPEARAKGLLAAKELDREDEAMASFYKAQLHLSQERFDLAESLLEKALGSLFDLNFESKAAEAQLALFYEN